MSVNPAQRPALRRTLYYLCLAAAVMLSSITGCSSDKPEAKATTAAAHDHEDGHSHEEGDEHDHGKEEAGNQQELPPGTVAIPPQVRQNLGITLAKVEMRHVAHTMRVPGKFEPMPRSVRRYHVPLAGRVELLVHQYDHVTTGTPLYRLNSADWRKMQQELLTARAEVLSTSASLMTAQIASEGGASAEVVAQQRIETSEAHITNLRESVKVAESRTVQVQKLQEVMGGKLLELNEARSQVAKLKAELSQAEEDRAELNQQQIQLSSVGGSGAFGTSETVKANMMARRAEYESAQAQEQLQYANILSVMGSADPVTTTSDQWTLIPEVTIHALTEGTVSELSVSTGAYVDASALVVTTLNTNELRFRALALQSDVQRLDKKMKGRILRPGKASGTDDAIEVTVMPGLEADAEERTLDLIADIPSTKPWARVGLSTDLEIALDETEDAEPAIPNEAVIQDGMDKIFFRRLPDNPNLATRVKADLGLSDGHWVVVESGLKAGDEVVLDGVYELKLATADAPDKGGHVHADGTFHEGKD